MIGFGGPLAGLATIATPGQSVPPKAILLAVAVIVFALSYAAALFALGVLVQVGDGPHGAGGVDGSASSR